MEEPSNSCFELALNFFFRRISQNVLTKIGRSVASPFVLLATDS